MAPRAVSFFALTLAVLFGAGGVAAEPTAEQVAAIKANCRSNYMSYCWSVPRGGPEAAQCLKKNLAKLSPACQQAVKAATAAAAPPSAPAPKAQPSATASPAAPPATEASPAEGSKPDAASAIATPESMPAPAAVPASPPQANPTTSAIPPAKAKVEEPAAAEKPAAVPSPKQPAANTAASEPPPVIIGNIPPRKKLMVFKNCRKDLEAYCPDVSYGEGRQLHCLFSHKAALSPDCQDTLAKLTR